MNDLQIYVTLAVFGAVILAIALDAIDMALAALLGVSVLIGLGILHERDLTAALKTAGGRWRCCSGAWWSPTRSA